MLSKGKIEEPFHAALGMTKGATSFFCSLLPWVICGCTMEPDRLKSVLLEAKPYAI